MVAKYKGIIFLKINFTQQTFIEMLCTFQTVPSSNKNDYYAMMGKKIPKEFTMGKQSIEWAFQEAVKDNNYYLFFFNFETVEL
ncbi:hypothetical protein NEOC65_000923 [Neochlamydia sp. AcF65]|uniref:hypothetical protein n=1 Tax=Neochlamydia sp. AcF65 TaxID=2795735 RepID=UPI001BCA1BDC|nr:hypothetical protein [Neochlamydia sp. AcF65]MBS4165851.1 hypothetical protein [Neochlamydia sp. AcF65]